MMSLLCEAPCAGGRGSTGRSPGETPLTRVLAQEGLRRAEGRGPAGRSPAELTHQGFAILQVPRKLCGTEGEHLCWVGLGWVGLGRQQPRWRLHTQAVRRLPHEPHSTKGRHSTGRGLAEVTHQGFAVVQVPHKRHVPAQPGVAHEHGQALRAVQRPQSFSLLDLHLHPIRLASAA